VLSTLSEDAGCGCSAAKNLAVDRGGLFDLRNSFRFCPVLARDRKQVIEGHLKSGPADGVPPSGEAGATDRPQRDPIDEHLVRCVPAAR